MLTKFIDVEDVDSSRFGKEVGQRICFHLEDLLEVGCMVASRNPWRFDRLWNFLFERMMRCFSEDDLGCLGDQSMKCSR